jgi:hypothetical protein
VVIERTRNRKTMGKTLTHELKSWPQYFEATLDGTKNFELRKNDRDYQAGDLVVLREYEPGMDRYTGRYQVHEITYVLTTGPWLQKDYCAFGINEVARGRRDE